MNYIFDFLALCNRLLSCHQSMQHITGHAGLSDIKFFFSQISLQGTAREHKTNISLHSVWQENCPIPFPTSHIATSSKEYSKKKIKNYKDHESIMAAGATLHQIETEQIMCQEGSFYENIQC